MRVGLSTAGWFRLYTDSASRANDTNRSVGEDPLQEWSNCRSSSLLVFLQSYYFTILPGEA